MTTIGLDDLGTSTTLESNKSPAEEPDAGNPLVRIWRGAGMGNRSAYSTTVFLLRCLWERTPGTPPPGRRIASVSRGLCLQRGAADRFGVRLQGAPGARAWAWPVVAGKGGRMAHGSAQAQRARRRWDDATGRGLSRMRRVLGDHGPGQSEEEQTPAGDAVGYA